MITHQPDEVCTEGLSHEEPCVQIPGLTPALFVADTSALLLDLADEEDL